MKNIEIDEELYQFIATNTQFIGESASSILRRLLSFEQPMATTPVAVEQTPSVEQVTHKASKTVKQANKPSKSVKQVSKASKPVKQTKSAAAKPVAAKPVVAKPVTAKAVNKKPKSNSKISQDTVFNYINKEELAMQRGAVGRFLLILAALFRVHQQDFYAVVEIRGRDRLYFSLSEDSLNANGSSTKPRAIPNSPYWVVTNSNTTRKKVILNDVAKSMGYSDLDAEKIRELL